MTPHEIELALALRHNVGMLPGSSQKRFARDIAHIAATEPASDITLRQRHYMELLAWKYRRQLPHHLVPHAKPLSAADVACGAADRHCTVVRNS